MIDVEKVRADFPILGRAVNEKPLIYLDSGATSQRPVQVIEAVAAFEREHNANVHRGLYQLAAEATDLYEEARAKVARFIGAVPEEIVFTGGTTEALNLAAFSLGETRVKGGDEIVVTVMEHHANLVPWQEIARRKGAELVPIGITPEGKLDLGELERRITGHTRVVAVAHVSNVLGTGPVRAPPAGLGAGARGGHFCLLRAQDARANRDRGLVGKERAFGRASAVSHRGGDDPGGMD